MWDPGRGGGRTGGLCHYVWDLGDWWTEGSSHLLRDPSRVLGRRGLCAGWVEDPSHSLRDPGGVLGGKRVRAAA